MPEEQSWCLPLGRASPPTKPASSATTGVPAAGGLPCLTSKNSAPPSPIFFSQFAPNFLYRSLSSPPGNFLPHSTLTCRAAVERLNAQELPPPILPFFTRCAQRKTSPPPRHGNLALGYACWKRAFSSPPTHSPLHPAAVSYFPCVSFSPLLLVILSPTLEIA